MSNSIKIGNLAAELANEISKYTTTVADSVKAAVDETMKELKANVKNDAPKRTGIYKDYIFSKKLFESQYEKRVILYVKDPDYRLTHLLEDGHRKRGGGCVRAYPHFAKNEETAKEKFEKRVKEIIQNGGA